MEMEFSDYAMLNQDQETDEQNYLFLLNFSIPQNLMMENLIFP